MELPEEPKRVNFGRIDGTCLYQVISVDFFALEAQRCEGLAIQRLQFHKYAA